MRDGCLTASAALGAILGGIGLSLSAIAFGAGVKWSITGSQPLHAPVDLFTFGFMLLVAGGCLSALAIAELND